MERSFVKIREEYNKIAQTLSKLLNSRERYINLNSPPYNTSEIFLSSIIEYMANGKSVLYITDENEKDVEIVKLIKRSNHKDYIYYRGKTLYTTSNFIVCNYENAFDLQFKFDLVIYDDIRSFPMHNRREIIRLLERFETKECKFIAYSVDSIFDRGREITIPINYDGMPVVEPRVILTRIDINNDMPFVVYDYLKWSVSSNKNTVIPVKDINRMNSFFNYLTNYKLGFKGKVFEYSSKNKKMGLGELKKSIIITDRFDEVLTPESDANIMVYFNEDNRFSFKSLIYFCGRTGKSDISRRGEVIFIANKETECMEKAKDITRNFNKIAWEKGLLTI
ncbi:hypothetical protein [Clostridium felsineum]|uniref:Uncharacterized protein n=1 Tax=Clostridium felsineum TaxID=36839 RepID=A0A1S8KX49_9CLOT|nr:hypothetical protein [Clostridium felsineum]MCR3758400.1 hypothetical protein [Clostridium felsineum]URZ07933.1 hypothetical protein CLROS_032950 [Clostridium felsineum]URZ12964.1 hypothetical protein CROST_037100 [Clostridium felsineum]URZ15045.1 hypothetical protein CLFE_010620 [Clostridium felsineum DSM 794]